MNKNYLLLLLIVPTASFGWLFRPVYSKEQLRQIKADHKALAIQEKEHLRRIRAQYKAWNINKSRWDKLLCLAKEEHREDYYISEALKQELKLKDNLEDMKIIKRRSPHPEHSLFYLNGEMLHCPKGSLIQKLMQRAIHQDKQLKELKKEKRDVAHALEGLELVIENMGKEAAQEVNKLVQQRDDLAYRLEDFGIWIQKK